MPSIFRRACGDPRDKTRHHLLRSGAGGGGCDRIGPRARRGHRSRPCPWLLGAGLDPLPPRQDRDHGRRLHHPRHPRRRSSARRSPRTSSGTAPATCSLRRSTRTPCFPSGRDPRLEAPYAGATATSARHCSCSAATASSAATSSCACSTAPRSRSRWPSSRRSSSMVIGVLMGSIAGYFGGCDRHGRVAPHGDHDGVPVPALHHRAGQHRGPRLDGITLGVFEPGVVTLVLILGFFGWYYPARIVRAAGAVAAREGVRRGGADGRARATGKIIRSHLVPHLVAPIIVLSTITVAQFILAEAGLSFLGVGIKEPVASWGSLLA